MDGLKKLPHTESQRVLVYVSVLSIMAGLATPVLGQQCTTYHQCEDGNPCTWDNCIDGFCTNPLVPDGWHLCPSDGIDCTADWCVGGECHTPTTGYLCTDDGNLCTRDVCEAGVCTHQPVADGKPFCTPDGVDCTADYCVDGECYTPTTGDLCTDEGNHCTYDVCDAGVCTHPPRPNHSVPCVSDGDHCTADYCMDGECYTPTTGNYCDDDGNPCTYDVCEAGACTHPPRPDGSLECWWDGNPCTSEYCLGGECYTPTNEGGACNDDNACTEDDMCSNGACVGTPIQCDNENYCDGIETCDEDLGCLPGDPPCPDSHFCNGEESCDEENDRCVSTLDPGQLDICDNQCWCDHSVCNELTDTCGDSIDLCPKIEIDCEELKCETEGDFCGCIFKDKECEPECELQEECICVDGDMVCAARQKVSIVDMIQNANPANMIPVIVNGIGDVVMFERLTSGNPDGNLGISLLSGPKASKASTEELSSSGLTAALVYIGNGPYDISTSGSIKYIGIEFDYQLLDGSAVGLAIAVRQNNAIYASIIEEKTETVWTYESTVLPMTLLFLQDTGVQAPQRPDFSPMGSPLEFGIIATNQTSPGDTQITFAIDNLQIWAIPGNPADLDDSGFVENGDLQHLINDWLLNGTGLLTDFNGDNVVNILDMSFLSKNWGL